MFTRKIKKIRKMNGGIPIYPGGYSCIFKPQLKCKTRTKKINIKKSIKNNKHSSKNSNENTGISKLLFKKYADVEMHNIQKFYHALRKIPKSHKYFLFAKTTSCPPAKISTRDLHGFDEMCENFTSHDVNESNINTLKNIRNLRLINMPNAGLSVNEWLFLKDKNGATIPLTISRVKIFNKLISKLILDAIVPMNREGVIHNDMKEDNVLINDSVPTIIDWGISGISTRDEIIPEIIMNRYISITNPFSSILFTTEFSKNYSEFLKQTAITTADDVDNMRHNPPFLQKLRDFSIEQYLKYNEYGHYSNIRTFFVNVHIFFTNVYSSNAFSDISPDIKDIMLSGGTDGLYHTLASKYISDVLVHFTEFDERDSIVRFNYVAYFTKVYIFNCDLWGLLFCYNVFFLFQDKYKYEEYIDIEPSVYSSFLHSLLSMYMGEVMINGHKKINVYKIIKLLKNLIN
jgi:tRNA A-37 threonylcarbamoyl transferase component Bud32